MNTLSIRKFGNLDIARWTHPSGAYFECIPDLGSCLFQLSFTNKGKAITLFPEFQEVNDFIETYQNKFAGALLFPFPNRVNQGVYNFEGEQYHLEKASYSGDHAIHGLVFNQKFQLDIDEEKNCLKTDFSFDESQFHGYPFAFSLKNNFYLGADYLEMETTITNLSKEKAPFGIGWHPYFDFGVSLNEIKLKLPGVKNLRLDNVQIPTGEFEPFSHFSNEAYIGTYPFDHCLKPDQENEYVSTELITPEHTISIDQKTGTPGYNFNQIYHLQDKAWLAVEPMSCAPDALNNGMGLEILNPNEKATYFMQIKLR